MATAKGVSHFVVIDLNGEWHSFSSMEELRSSAVGQCIPSREHLYSMGYDVAVPVEEDNVFAPRKLEKIPNRT